MSSACNCSQEACLDFLIIICNLISFIMNYIQFPYSFIHSFHITLILYRCGNSHIRYLNLSVFGLSYSTKHLEHNEALQEVYRSTLFSLKHMWRYKLPPIFLASLCTEMCVITYQDDATDQQIAHWLLTLKAQVLFHGAYEGFVALRQKIFWLLQLFCLLTLH